MKEDEPNVLFVGTYPPRECGIATFTHDLITSVSKVPSSYNPAVIAMNKNGVNIYNYPKNVLFQISDTSMEDYIETAKRVNQMDSIKMVCVQHEFGIFGGEFGDSLLAFLEILQKPVIVTFHSIMPFPNTRLKQVVRAIADKVKAVVVMTKKGVDILRNDYNLTTDIYIIPHGIPTVCFESQEKEKQKIGMEGKIILSSFGMVGPGKGYESAIDALPEVIKKFPNVVYLIIGETHPVVRKVDGERYRNFLEKKVKDLKLQNHVKFYNKYLSLQEIVQYLKASDVYVSTSENPDQITSGTLSYALGCGRVAISTPFLHAKDLFEEHQELLVKFDNVKSFENAIISVLSNERRRKEIEIEMYHKTRHMTWPNVGLAYSKLFRKYLDLSERPRIIRLPKINTSHLMRMTDDFGIIQFANQIQPDLSSGYTLDDNARALLVSMMHYEKFREYKQLKLIRTYLDYVKYVQAEEGKLYNHVDKDKKVDYGHWSEDAHGRALWALGYLISSELMPEDFKREAEEIFLNGLNVGIDSPRAISFMVTGLYYYNNTKKSDKVKKKIIKLADYLISLYKSTAHPEWNWFESYLTYANSKLPEGLFYAYLATGKKEYLEVARESLDFLISKTFSKNVFTPIGQRGWYHEGGKKALFDQQPIDAAYTVQTLLLAYKVTGEKKYIKLALNSFLWFLGKNSLNQVIYNEETGGCFDGVGEQSININQGAESTLSYLLARLSMAGIEN